MDKSTRISELTDLWDKAQKEFKDKYWDSGKENSRYRRGQSWTDAEEKEIIAGGRQPYNIPVLPIKMNTLISQQMQTPYDIIAIPRTQDDEISAEIKNSIFKYIRDTNDLQYLMSEWYQDGMIKKYGVIKREIDTTEDIQGEIKCEKVQYDHFVWDTNCKKFNIARYANWCGEVLYMTRTELASKYPAKKEMIESLQPTDKNDQSDDKYTDWYMNDKGQELIKIIKHYQRKFRKSYKTTYNTGEVEVLDEEPVIDFETEEGQARINADAGAKYPTDSNEQEHEYIECIIFTKDLIEELDSYEEETNLFRYHLYFSNFDDGEIFCLMDLLKGSQRLLNRLATQIDTSISKLIKNSYEIEWEHLHDSDKENWIKLSKDLVVGGAVARKKKGFSGRLITAIDSGKIPPELFQTWQFVIQVLEDGTGGRNLQGLQESGGESGKAILARQEQGFLMAYLYLYNLGRALKGLGEGLNEDINEIYGNSVERIIDITDNDLDEKVKQKFQEMGIYQQGTYRQERGYLTIDKETAEQMLGKAKTRIIIERGKYQPTERERKLDEWKMLNEWMIQAGQQPYPASIMIDEFSFSSTIKEKIKQHEAQIAKQQAEAQALQKEQMLFNANQSQQKETREAFKSLPPDQPQEVIRTGVTSGN